MIKKEDKNQLRQRRHARVRKNVSGTAETPRLNVYRSLNHIYVQVIDDVKGVTIASASTMEKRSKSRLRARPKRKPRKWSDLLRVSEQRQKGSRRSCSTAADISIRDA